MIETSLTVKDMDMSQILKSIYNASENYIRENRAKPDFIYMQDDIYLHVIKTIIPFRLADEKTIYDINILHGGVIPSVNNWFSFFAEEELETAQGYLEHNPRELFVKLHQKRVDIPLLGDIITDGKRLIPYEPKSMEIKTIEINRSVINAYKFWKNINRLNTI